MAIHKHSTPFTLACGMAMLSVPCVLLLVEWLTFTFGAGVGPWMFPLAIASACFLAWYLTGSAKAPATVIALIFIYVIVATGVYDPSYDGTTYHQHTVLSLVHGWNPLRSLNPGDDAGLYTMHYARAIEMCQAAICSFTGNVESGKSLNLILFTAMGAVAWHAADAFVPSGRRRFIATFIVCANPVLLSQLFTGYVDYTIYVYTVLSLCFIIFMTGNGGKAVKLAALYGFLAVEMLAIGTKFNAFFYEGVLVGAWIVWLVCHRQRRMAAAVAMLCATVAVFSVCLVYYNPYITNILAASNPFYPLMGAGSVDIMTGNTPPEVLPMNRFAAFFYSMAPHKWVINHDTRLGGFSPFFSVMLLASAATIFLRRGKIPAAVYYVGAVTLATCFVFGQSWWARYVPQLWLIPLLAYLSLQTSGKSVSVLRRLITVCAIGAFLCTSLSIKDITRYNVYKRWLLSQARAHAPVTILSPNASDIETLSHNSIAFTVKSGEPDTLSALKIHEGGGAIEFDRSVTPQLASQMRQHTVLQMLSPHRLDNLILTPAVRQAANIPQTNN